jgi:hypothetical protein
MSLHITTQIACDRGTCSARSTVPPGTTVEYHRSILANRRWSRQPAVRATAAGPAIGGYDYCPKHATVTEGAR